MKKWLKEVFCKDEWEHKVRIEKFSILSRDKFDIICKKCGKVKGSYLKKYNDKGTGYI